MIDRPDLGLVALLPEYIAAGAAMLVLLIGVGHSLAARIATHVLTMLAFIAIIVVVLATFTTTHYGAFGAQVVSDELANTGRLIAAFAGFIASLIAVRGRPDDHRHGEYNALLLLAVAGMGLLAAAASFLTVFIGLELFSICLYVLSALDAERRASLEAGLKYLIVGGMSGAFLLYGAALVYGATGSLDFVHIGAFSGVRGMLLFAGAAMVLSGLAFKVSAAPMHWWTPDVYQGAPTPVTAFMSTATKAAAFLALTRVLITAFPHEAHRWMPLIALLAVFSIVVGNLGALVQRSVKRMLAYSSIAQAGYLLCALVGWKSSGIPALTYALFVYVAMTLGAFAYLMVVERDLGREVTFADLAGRGWIGPDDGLLRMLPAIGMSVCMLSLAGIPPLAGFFGKFGLFSAAVDAGYGWLAVVGAVGSVISLAYYLRVIVELYMQQPDIERVAADVQQLPAPATDNVPQPGVRMPVTAATAVALAALVLVLAFVPGRVFRAGCDARRELLPGTGACTSVTATVDAASAG